MNYVPRFPADALHRAATTFPVVMVTGARQTGKTTLLRHEFGGSHRYVSLDRPDVRLRAQSDPVPGSLCFWKSGRGNEIDYLVAEATPLVRGDRLPVEVKGNSTAPISNARKSISRAFGRGSIEPLRSSWGPCRYYPLSPYE